ncbi:uncharacterized protein NPIL_665721 [Nephila pilipes]|uniref:Uncharacterized protein n=1 Tax=Nephila pilipes TaxID=299642 RepID=A0A8X6QD99_NEPPI|nr:uncharacterized protein NPIL_403341 [Nephila pilipes]GFU13335.1 uncharacterized protein NPIL_665721 [Nephila pilipes]
MGAQSNCIQENIPLFSASTDSTIEIQEFIHSNLKLSSTELKEESVMKNIQFPCISKDLSLHVEEVVNELPSTSAELPSQFRSGSLKNSVQDMVYILCLKEA